MSNARKLAIMALQSDRYLKDMDFRDAVDDVLNETSNEIFGCRRGKPFELCKEGCAC